MISNSNDDINFPQKLLLTDRQATKLRKAFANNSSANINLSKTQLSTIMKIFWRTFWTITKTWITINKKCN